MADEMQSGEVQKNATATAKASIKEFPDVRDPNHWAYQDLEKLVDHRCVAGFPDGTFQGEQPVSCFEKEKHIHHTNNTSTPHPHEPADHEHPIDPSGHLPGRTVETRVALSQENIEKYLSPIVDNIWPKQASFSTNLFLPPINGPPAG